jgi:DNA-binding transcriptional LysR family regulator
MADRKLSIDWDDLQVFLAVFRSGSLRGAARMLQLNHATVNRRLKALEAGFGARLFDRTPGGFAPTQAGDDLLEYAERVEEELFQAQQQIAERDTELSGEVKVSFPYAILKGFLAPDLHRFSQLYPGINLDMELTDRFSDLLRLEADVSIRMAHGVNDDVVGRRLVQYAKSIYAAPGLASELGSIPDTLEQNQTWIGWHAGDGENGWVRNTPYPNLPARHNLPSHALQLEMARAGLGIAMLPCFLGDQDRDLVRVPGAVAIPDRSIWLLLRSDLRKTARMRTFVDFIATAILSHRNLLEGQAGSKVA